MVTKLAKPTSVDEYFERLSEPARTTLGKVRKALLAAAPPGTTEGIGYQMPALRYNGRFVFYYAAFKTHGSLFPASGRVIEQFSEELKPYDLDKGTIRFPLDKAPPAALLKKLLEARLALDA